VLFTPYIAIMPGRFRKREIFPHCGAHQRVWRGYLCGVTCCSADLAASYDASERWWHRIIIDLNAIIVWTSAESEWGRLQLQFRPEPESVSSY